MKRGFELTLLVAFVVAAYPAVVRADGAPGDFDFRYVIEAPSASDPILIPDASLRRYDLQYEQLNLMADPTLGVDYMEFEIGGLSHDAAMDLNIFLLDPFGGGIELMDEAGDQVSVQGINITFSDKGVPLPHEMGVGLESGTVYIPDGTRPGNNQTFSSYYDSGDIGGRDSDANAPHWSVLIVDDDTMADGSFQSLTLRGHYVPEPATLSLLAFGALALLRRRR